MNSSGVILSWFLGIQSPSIPLMLVMPFLLNSASQVPVPHPRSMTDFGCIQSFSRHGMMIAADCSAVMLFCL